MARHILSSWLTRAIDLMRGRSSAPSRRAHPPICLETLEDRTLLSITLLNGGFQTPTWVDKGPGPLQDAGITASPDDAVTGAIEAILEHPTNNNMVFAGAVAGGVWRTNDVTGGGNPLNIVWTPLSDQLASLYVSSMAFSPTSPNTLFVGTGSYSNTFRNQFAEAAVGIYRTTNASGANVTWELLGASVFAGLPVRAIALSSANPNLILAAAADASGAGGLFRSLDGGATWTELTDGTILPFTTSVTDVVADPNNGSRFYASAPNAGVFQSDDGGATWNRIDNLNAAITGIGFSSNIEMAVHDFGTRTVLYVGVIDSSGEISGVFRYGQDGMDDNGNGPIDDFAETTWRRIASSPPDIHQGGMGFNNFSLVADPSSPFIVYVGGDRPPNIFRGDASANNGLGTWTGISHNPSVSRSGPHADSRDLIVLRNGSLLEADDGGIFRLTRPLAPQNGTDAWTGTAGSDPNGLRTIEFHGIAYDTSAGLIFGGSQDNGSEVQTSAASQAWTQYLGGDGSTQAYSIPGNVRYSLGNNFGLFVRNGTTQLALRKQVGSTSIFDGLEGQSIGLDDQSFASFGGFESHLPVAPNRFNGNFVMFGRRALYTSPNRGDNIVTILSATGIAGEKNETDRFQAAVFGGRRNATNFSNVYYAGTDEGRLYTRDETNVLFDRTAALTAAIPGTARIDDIAVDPEDYRRVWVLKNNRVGFSSDGGVNFTDVTGNLANLSGVLRSLAFADPTPGLAGDGVILVGGLGGVFRGLAVVGSPANSFTWSEYGANLPNTLVQDLDYVATDPDAAAFNGTGLLLAGTFGRGAWMMTNVTATVGISPILEVVGNGNANAMELRADPNDANNVIVSDGLGNAATFSRSQFDRVRFRGLGGADMIRIDSNGAAAGGDVNFVTFPVEVEGGGNIGDTLVVQDGSETSATNLTITSTQIGSFGGGIATATGAVSTPLVVTTTLAHGLVTGDVITIQGVGGTNGSLANGATRTITVLSPTTFSLDGILSDGTTGAGGSWSITSNLFGASGSIDYTGFSMGGVMVQLGSGADTVRIFGTHTGTTGVMGGDGTDTFAVRATSGLTVVSGENANDLFQVSSTAGTATSGDLNGIAGELRVDGGGGVGNRLILDDRAATATNLAVVQDEVNVSGALFERLMGLAGPFNLGTILYRASGGSFTNGGTNDGILVRGSDLADQFTIQRSLSGSTLTVEGNNGDDTFNAGASFNDDNGNFDNLRGLVTFVGGMGNDKVYANDRGKTGRSSYAIDETSIRTILFVPADQLRPFAGIDYDTATELVQVDGTDGVNTFALTPSLTKRFRVDGNLPLPATPGPAGGDALVLNVNLMTSGAVENTAGFPPGAGVWTFTNGLQNVEFDSLEPNPGPGPGPGGTPGGPAPLPPPGPLGIYAVGSDGGPNSLPIVTVYDGASNAQRFRFLAYEASFRGGVRLTTGDVNGDGTPDVIVAPGRGRSSTVKIYNGINGGLLTAFTVFTPNFLGGIHVAMADVSGDGRPDLIVGAGAGWLPLVHVLDGAALLGTRALVGTPFLAFDSRIRGGVTVAGGPMWGDNRAEVVVGSGQGMTSTIRIFTRVGGGFGLLDAFQPFGRFHTQGLFVAVGDFNRDRVADIIIGSAGGWLPLMQIYNGANVGAAGTPGLLFSQLAFEPTFRGGVHLGTQTTAGVGVAGSDLLVIFVSRGPGGGTRVVRRLTNARTELVDQVFLDAAYASGAFVG